MKSLSPITLQSIKQEAKFLYKSLTYDYPEVVQRFLTVRPFNKLDSNSFIDHLSEVKLKHAYAVLASEYGFDHWSDLKKEIVKQDLLYRASGVAYVHAWFSNYQEALSYFKQHGGFLLNFWKDYIVCGKEYIALLQLDHLNDEWEKIGYNWVVPKDIEAYNKLVKHAERQYLHR